ncbi:SAM-dependent methyltransferase [uncultured Shewanella sp.]|uniref:SAM-dependent methyltransferase n=1 Tax=uncultured Shewanella sp. TaxID=173975 RepID=UPI00261FC2D7|nr:SAM-dependent methyltransferase [uncultured Shewanella sp.]
MDSKSLDSHKSGSLVCVGTGLNLAGQITVLSQSYIEHADTVFSLMPDGFAERWVGRLNSNVRSLQSFYAQKGEVKNRRDTYAQMVNAIVAEVRLGKKVVCALYGHPGVFACVGHLAIEQLQREGFRAQMEPGVSAESCLWADLGVDPASSGHQSVEASQFMFYRQSISPAAYLVLWQIGLAGEHTLTKFHTCSDKLQVLVELLAQWYPLEHEVILYEAATLPVQSPRIDKLMLKDLPQARLTDISTLCIPPSEALQLNEQALAKLEINADDFG